MNCPCKDCDNRNIACHSVCEEYKKYKEDAASLKLKIDKQKEIYRNTVEIKISGILRCKKSKHFSVKRSKKGYYHE